MLIIFAVNVVFISILFTNNLPFNVDNVKTINGMFSLTIMDEDISNCWQEVFISVSITPEILRHWIIFFGTILFLILISFCVSVFCKNKSSQFYKVSLLDFCTSSMNNSIDSDLKSFSKFEFYSSESVKLQENLNLSVEIYVWLILSYLNWQIRAYFN